MNRLQKWIYNRVTRWANDPGSARIWPMPRSRTAGEHVTTDSALTYSAIWRAVTLISDTIATLPWDVYGRTVDGSGRVTKTVQTSHPAARLLDLKPNIETDALSFRQALIGHALTWGNGYAEITRDRAGRPAELWLIEPERVRVERNEAGRLVYIVNNGSTPDTTLPPENVFHLRGPSYDGVMGYSVISYAARSIGVGMATEQFGADLFQNGAFPSMVIAHPGLIGSEAIKNLKESVENAVSGRQRHKAFVLEEGMSAQQWTIPPEDAQFLETRRFNIAEIARWYGVPLHKLQDMERATFSNIEQQNIEFVTGSLLSWIRRLELEANIKLVSSQAWGRVYTKLNMNAILRGDTESRGKWYRVLSDLGVLTINDILGFEDMNPIGADGDKRLVQANRTPIDKIGEENVDNGFNSDSTATASLDDPESGQSRDPDPASPTDLASVVSKIVSRGVHRTNEALQHKKTLKDFTDWLERFAADQHDYMQKKLGDQYNENAAGDYLQGLKIRAVDCFNREGVFTDDTEQLLTDLVIR